MLCNIDIGQHSLKRRMKELEAEVDAELEDESDTND